MQVPELNFLYHLLICIFKTIWLIFLFLYCRSNFLQNNKIEKVVLLTQRKEKYLVVAAVRFIRTVLSRHVSVDV